MEVHVIEAGVELVKSNPSLAIGVSTTLIAMAFSSRVRRIILRRDGGCVKRDETCNGGLEASHKDHSRQNPDYKHPDNGDALCTKHHLDDHIEREGENGLSIGQNRWAISTIKKRLGL